MKPGERRLGRGGRVLAALAIGIVAGVVAGNIYEAVQTSGPDQEWTTRAKIDDVTTVPEPDDRLRDAASTLTGSPLYVDPELAFLIPADERDQVRDALAAGPPTFVAVLPSFEQDGFGGNREAALIALADAVGQDGLYVVVDQDYFVYSVHRYGDAIMWPDVRLREGRLSAALIDALPAGRRQWTPEES